MLCVQDEEGAMDGDVDRVEPESGKHTDLLRIDHILVRIHSYLILMRPKDLINHGSLFNRVINFSSKDAI